tara:strand:- start:129 stop:620 length:492 start_codon:yes stop_codon:yes gene_type:complete
MPLLLPVLQADLVSIYEKGPAGNPAPPLVGIKTSKAYMSFVQPGINAGAGATIAMPGMIPLGLDLGEIMSSPSPDGSLTAQKMAKAFDSCLQTYISLFQTTIVTASGLPGLISDLVDLFATPIPSSTLFATKFATALNTYTLSATVSGIIPGTPPIPFSGPIG